MTTTIEQLEQWLAETLTNTLLSAGVAVHVFPDAKTPKESGRAVLARQVYVGFVREESSDPPRSALRMVGHPLNQEETLIFEASIHLKDLRSHTGVYALKAAIKKAIKGARPLREHPTSAFWLREFAYQSLDQGIWSYDMTIAINTPYE